MRQNNKIRFRGKVAANLCKVNLEYRDHDMNIVSQKECALEDYTELLKSGIVRLILDAEDLIYKATGGQGKAEWDDEVSTSFYRLRHKLLDMAGEVGRIPQNLMVEMDGYVPSSPMVYPMSFSSSASEEPDNFIQASPFRLADEGIEK